MRAGQLRERLVIESYANADVDRAGQIEPKWKRFAEVWGRIEEAGASETNRADQIQASGTHTVTIRYTQGIDSKMRVCWTDGTDKRLFGIEGVTRDERRESITLICRESS